MFLSESPRLLQRCAVLPGALVAILAALACGEPMPEDLDPDAIALDFARYYSDGPGSDERVYGLHFFGMPIVQNPMDLFIYQEILTEVRPELVIEAGTFASGTALYFAHLLETLRPPAKVIAIDLRPRWEQALAKVHPPPIRDRVRALFERRIEVVTSNSIAPELIAMLTQRAQGKKTLVTLDSCHNVDHVKRELELYAPLVSVGSYLIVQDTLTDRRPEWVERIATCDGYERVGGPLLAVQEFLDTHPEFQVDRSREKLVITWNPSGYLKRIR
jgi:cephalosporin hydroxylase